MSRAHAGALPADGGGDADANRSGECVRDNYAGDLPPAVSCTGEVQACVADQGTSCVASFTITLERAIDGCGQYCGALEIGFHSGCVTAVGGFVGTSQPTREDQAMACIRQRLIGTRWACAITQGWQFLSVGSCTIQ